MRKAERALRTANLLLEDTDYDGAASRSYYAMFYATEALLLGMALSFSSHAAVISAFGNEFAKMRKMPSHLHRFLIDAQKLRAVADYETSGVTSKENAGIQISRAVEFLASAEAYLESPVQPPC